MGYRKEKNFKQTEIGLIPEGWEIDILNRDIHINGHIGWKVLKLGDVCDISSSKRIYAKEYKPTGIPFYRGKEIIEKFNGRNISTELFIKKERFNELKDKFGAPVKGDILLTSVGTLGVPYLVQNEKFYFKDGNLTWFKNFKGSYSEFIFLWLQSLYAKNQIDRKAIGSTQKALTIDVLKKFEINLPPIQEQKAIADTLTCLDNKIELNNQINRNLEQITQTLFKHWFIDFEFPDENNHNLPYKSSGGEMVDSELGKIPKGWGIVKLSDISSLVMGISPKGESYNYNEKGIPLINGAADFNDELISPKKFTINPIKNCKFGDIILCIRATIGNITFSDKIYCLGRGVAAIQSKNYYYKNFIFLFLKKELNNISKKATGSVISGLSKDDINNLKLVLPLKESLIKFSLISEKCFEKKSNLQKQSKTLSQIRDSLLPKLMTGKIRVNIEDESSEDSSNA